MTTPASYEKDMREMDEHESAEQTVPSESSGSFPTPSHKEYVQCPQCGTIEEATVEHTIPWWTYIHHCSECHYVIMESDWEKQEQNRGINGKVSF